MAHKECQHYESYTHAHTFGRLDRAGMKFFKVHL